jgi:chaperone modulatory protein CbpM
MKTTRSFTIIEASHLTGLEPTRIWELIHHEWICLADPHCETLDEEDVSRIRLIHELRADFGANDDSIPLILHLVDQLCSLREELQRRAQRG